MKQLYYAGFVMVVMLLANCTKVEKDVHDYFPVVKTVSAQVVADGSVEITGEILSSGNTDVYYVGFCADTVPNPRMTANQRQSAGLDGKRFTYTYEGLDATKKYYFRAWATNKEGYAIGGDVQVDSVFLPSDPVPCNLTINSISVNSATELYTNTSALVQSGGGWVVTATSNNHKLEVRFAATKPLSGKYIITKATPDDRYINMFLDNVAVNGGAEVYIRQLTGGKLKISLCSAFVSSGGAADDVLKTSFVTQ